MKEGTFRLFDFSKFNLKHFHFSTFRNSIWSLPTFQLFDFLKLKMRPFHFSFFRLFDFLTYLPTETMQRIFPTQRKPPYPASSEPTSLIMTQQWPRSSFDALLMILQRLEPFGSMSSSIFSSCKALHGQRHYYALCGGACCYFSSLPWDNIYFTTDPGSMPLSRMEIYVSSVVVAAQAFSGEELPELEIASTQFQGSFVPAVLSASLARILHTSPYLVRVCFAPGSRLSGSQILHANSPLRLQVAVVSQRCDQAELLFAAIEAADAVAVNSVLARGQCPNALNSAGTPPLYAALDSQSEPHPRVNTSEIAAMLIAAFADVHCRYDFGGTALHLASRQCLPHIIPDLLRARADVNALDSENDSPLHTAAIYGTLSCVELLLHSSANPRGCNLLHETPLTCACAYGSQPGVVSLLMAAASPSNWTSVFLMSLHHVALMLGKGPADLFSTCRALSHQSGNYPPCHGGSVIQAGATSLAGRPLWCDTHDSPISSEAETSAASPAGSPLLTCDTALQCHMCVWRPVCEKYAFMLFGCVFDTVLAQTLTAVKSKHLSVKGNLFDYLFAVNAMRLSYIGI